MVTATTILAIIIVWSAFSKPLDRRGITSALFLTAAGFAVGASTLGLFDIALEAEVVEHVAEFALVLLLFSDATRLDLRSLRHELGWPRRLLLIGLPLTMLAGAGIGALVFPGMALASAALLATMLAPTDAALGRKVVADTAVPARVRQALDVESGLNDGLAVPFFLVALEIANAELTTGVTQAVISNMAAQIGWGLTGGLMAGILGGLLFRAANRHAWMSPDWRQVITMAVALLAYALALTLGGSGFIAAFVAGIAFGRASDARGSEVTLFAEESGDFLAAVTWIGFGALALTWAVPLITWQVILYAVLSLTVVRMVPVAIAFAGQRVKAPTTAFIGWFGPRGLASLVFALLAFERGVPDGEAVFTTAAVTVALSVILHGLTSVPLVAAYHRWYEAHTAGHPAAAEATPATMPRRRHQFPVIGTIGRHRGGTAD
ncbi:cation:proton antiporter [Arthrobacter sp. I2-34]|uniref:Cation:proton antiporter n=1 Tax=Arthrobacter hankyongi TaxID=2904801 RepID=A0ABS9LAI4_9MICC|nr:cation:proton antiporter [Arthrobacter hankyongi]MCG2623701.1 cation:proton antiporter [Arthrobacter hankyongi]